MTFYDISILSPAMPIPGATYPIRLKEIEKEITNWFFLSDKLNYQFFLPTEQLESMDYRFGDFLTIERLPNKPYWFNYHSAMVVLTVKGKNIMGRLSTMPDSKEITVFKGNKESSIIQCCDVQRGAYVKSKYRYMKFEHPCRDLYNHFHSQGLIKSWGME